MFKKILSIFKQKHTQPSNWLKIDFIYKTSDLNKIYLKEDQIEACLNETRSGIFDGHEINSDLSGGSFFVVCSNFESAYNDIKELLVDDESFSFTTIMQRNENDDFFRIFNKAKPP